MMVCKVVYSPEKRESWREDEYGRYLCKDGTLRVRLRKYGDRKERIVGFKDKLRFLLTYLTNYYAREVMRLKDDSEGEYAKSQLASMCSRAIERVSELYCPEICQKLSEHMCSKDLVCITISTRLCRKEDDVVSSTIGDVCVRHDDSIADPLLQFGYDYRLPENWIACFLLDDGYEIAIEPTVPINSTKDTQKNPWSESIWF